MQRARIGRSEGASVAFRCAEVENRIRVFTTRPDTLYGATFLAVSPEYPDLDRLVEGTPRQAAVREYANAARRAGHADRGNDERPKTGVLTGRHAIHPLTGNKIPVVVTDYVLMEYGTGAIMGVPAHDVRDFDFAEALGLPIQPVIALDDGTTPELPFVGEGVAINSAEFDGASSRDAATGVVAKLAELEQGEEVVSYKLRDWLLSRQRYWGCPMFVDSSWYYLRYCDANNGSEPWSQEAMRAWMPVDKYIGGVEHAILHLLYSRFLCKALADLGHLPVEESFGKLFTQGMITKDGAKMSKSKGNVVSPRTIVEKYGADTARCYVLFMGPPEHGADWSDEGLEGVYRFFKRVWRYTDAITGADSDFIGKAPDSERDLALRRKTAGAIQKVTEDMSGRFAFNTAIAALMALSNDCSKALQDGIAKETVTEVVSTLASLLLPFAPHMSSEIYHRLTGKRVWEEPWPVADESLLRSETIDLIVQVNAKTRGQLSVPADASEEEIRQAVQAFPVVQAEAAGRSIKRIIVVPGRLANVLIA
ncbi:class I tRNA ligase family protein [Streptomyces sp. NPDC059816]|uniref:class I tRNA ligase family protein n=1 Tax=Streptomyces sp. NPDC059816 TaxID=3346960 RepID=UPI003665588D